jgi:hypothetical protein
MAVNNTTLAFLLTSCASSLFYMMLMFYPLYFKLKVMKVAHFETITYSALISAGIFKISAAIITAYLTFDKYSSISKVGIQPSTLSPTTSIS